MLALLNTFFSATQGCTSRTFNGNWPGGKKSLDCIITRQHTASLSETSLVTCSRVRIATTTSCAPQSDFPADLLVRKNSEPAQVRKSIHRRVITSNCGRRERLTRLVASWPTQADLWDEVR